MCVESQLDSQALFDIVFRSCGDRDNIVTMLHQCFLDDSKDQRQEFLYVCAGFYGTAPAWKKFDEAWNRQLKAEGIQYFKTSEWKSLTKQFLRYKSIPEPSGRIGANLVRGRLQQILQDSPGIRAIGIVVPVGDYTEVMKHESAIDVFGKNVYSRAFECCLLKATWQTCDGSDQIAFVHDDGPDFDTLRALYKSFKEKNPETASHMKGFLPLDDKDTPGLQIADMFANSVMGETNRQMQYGDGDARDIFMYERSKLFVWSQRFGEIILAANLESRRMTVPDSLAEALAIVHSVDEKTFID